MTDEQQPQPQTETNSISDDARNVLVVTAFFIILDGTVEGFSGYWAGSNLWIFVLSFLLVKKFGSDKSKSLPPLIFSGLTFLVSLALAIDALETVPAEPSQAKFIIGRVIIGFALCFMSFLLSRKIKNLPPQ